MRAVDVLSFFGGVSMLLFGIVTMSRTLEEAAGGSFSTLLKRTTANKYIGFLLGFSVTALLHSSAATTVMVVGLVSGGVLSLQQAVGVIIGANVGTTATAWLLSLTALSGDNVFARILQPTVFVPVLAVIGAILLLFFKSKRGKAVGQVLLGFCVLMFGMQQAADAAEPLQTAPWMRRLFLSFENPAVALIAGTALSALLQSSAACVGILQALSASGSITYSAALPLILGQNIGTCVTALLSAIGADKAAKRAAAVHLSFNLLGAALNLLLFYALTLLLPFPLAARPVSTVAIAALHSVCNLTSAAVFLPLSMVPEKLACLIFPDRRKKTRRGLEKSQNSW